jgi:uncharacterized protein YdiU (UPF0061 family)
MHRWLNGLKEMLSKYLQSSESKTIVKVLPRIVKNYNTSYHSSIKMAPNDVNSQNESIVWSNLKNRAKKGTGPYFEIGDKVRVRTKPKSFEKKYNPQYSKSVHTIENIKNGLVELKDLDRKYLKAHVMKVGENVEKRNIEPDIAGTKEGTLKEIAKRPVIPQSVSNPESKSIAQTRGKRVIKKPKKFDSD